jgi:hypothetical protein
MAQLIRASASADAEVGPGWCHAECLSDLSSIWAALRELGAEEVR